MLYYLFNYLDQCNFPGARMFNYVTFRAAVAIILALVVSVWFGNWFIKMLKRRKVVETQRDASIDPYNTKKIGVPTMGGVIIIASILIPVLLVGKLHSVYTLLMIATTLVLGILGFSDDYIKTFRHKKDGLPPKVKLAGQILLGLIVGLTLRFSPAVQINEKVELKIENNKEIVVKSPDVKSAPLGWPEVDVQPGVGFPRPAHRFHRGRCQQRFQPQRRHGRHGLGQFRHHRTNFAALGLYFQ